MSFNTNERNGHQNLSERKSWPPRQQDGEILCQISLTLLPELEYSKLS